MNQRTLRIDVYQGLEDIIGACENQEIEIRILGHGVILLSSFVGNAHNKFEIFQDSMAITHYFKHPDLFGIVNVNHEWLKFKTTLFLRPKVVDWPNLVACVFKLKSQTLLHDILKIYILGQTVAHVYTIEFQKCGLPHMHFFVFFVIENKVVDVIVLYHIICVEFPNPKTFHVCFNIILKTMVHSPCG